MARATSNRRSNEVEPDVSVTTDAQAESTDPTAESTDATTEPTSAGADEESDGGKADESASTASEPVDAGGDVLIEVLADGMTVRVGGRPLLLTREQRAKVSEDVAKRGEERKTLRRV